MKKQSAVLWLTLRYHHRQGYLSQEDLQQAKEMEKEQMKDAVMYGLDEDGHTGDWKISVAEGYYKKMYTNESNK